MAKEEMRDLSKEVKSQPPQQQKNPQQDASKEVKMVSVPADEWEMMKGMLKTLTEGLQQVQKTIPKAEVTERPMGTLFLKDPVKEGMIRKQYNCKLPHNPSMIVEVDLHPDQDNIEARDIVVGKYNQFFGIIATQHQHTVTTVEG